MENLRENGRNEFMRRFPVYFILYSVFFPCKTAPGFRTSGFRVHGTTERCCKCADHFQFSFSTIFSGFSRNRPLWIIRLNWNDTEPFNLCV